MYIDFPFDIAFTVVYISKVSAKVSRRNKGWCGVIVNFWAMKGYCEYTRLIEKDYFSFKNIEKLGNNTLNV